MVSPLLDSGMVASTSEDAILQHLPKPLYRAMLTKEILDEFPDEDRRELESWLESEEAPYAERLGDPFEYMDLSPIAGTLLVPLSTNVGEELVIDRAMSLATDEKLNKQRIHVYDLQLGRILTENCREDVVAAVSQAPDDGPTADDGSYQTIWDVEVRECILKDTKNAIFIKVGDEEPRPLGSIGDLLLAQELVENVSVAMPYITEELAENVPALSDIYSDQYLGLMTAEHEELDKVYDQVVGTWWEKQKGLDAYNAAEMVSASSRLAAALYSGPTYDDPANFVQRFMLAAATLSLLPEMSEIWGEHEGYAEVENEVQRAGAFLNRFQDAFHDSFESGGIPQIIINL